MQIPPLDFCANWDSSQCPLSDRAAHGCFRGTSKSVPRNHKIIEVGRDLWKLPSPTLVKAGWTTAGCLGLYPVRFFNIFMDRDTATSLDNMFQCLTAHHSKKKGGGSVFLCSDRTSCVSACACCLLSFHYIAWRKVWFCLLYCPPPPQSGIYTHW